MAMLEWFFLSVVLAFGLVIGSFLNVVIYRFHTGRSLNDRSHCLSCGQTLNWFELFPVLSYLFLRGRCRSCRSFIPYRYALVEALTAGLFLLAYLKITDLILLPGLLIFLSLLVIVCVYDIYHQIIPDELSISLAAVAVTMIGYQAWIGNDWSIFWSSVLAGAAAFTFFASLWWFSDGRWLGFGDAKLAVSLGLLVGLVGTFSMIVFSFWIGAFLSLILITLQKFVQSRRLGQTFGRVNMKSEVPFAPFLILAFILVYFFNADALSLIEWVYGIA